MEERSSMPPQRSKVTLRVPDVSGSLDRKYLFKTWEESQGWESSECFVLCVYVCVEGHTGLVKENAILSWLDFYYYKEQKS